MENLNSSLIIERMKGYLNIKTDEELGINLGKEQAKAASAVRNWKSRNNMPIEVILTFAHTHNLSLDWLILGKESPALGEMETELLKRFAALSFSAKIDLFNRLQGTSTSNQHIGGNGFNIGGGVTVNQK